MDDRITEEALAWHVALKRDDADWQAFTAWLEADPRHRAAYDDVALIDDSIDANRAAVKSMLIEDEPTRPARLRRWQLAGLAAAAAVLIAVGASLLLPRAPAPAIYETAAAQSRDITLADGSAVTLAPASRLVIKGRHQGDMTLEGSAYFDIKHDPSRQLVIHAGPYEISDIGTQFDVTSAPAGLTVSVAEGHLAVSGRLMSEPVQVAANQRLLATQGTHTEIAPVQSGDVGSWRKGRLVYQDVPLSLVTSDISRYVGKPVVADPALADRRFSGVLTIGDGSGLVGDLQQFMGLDVRNEGDSVRLVPRHN